MIILGIVIAVAIILGIIAAILMQKPEQDERAGGCALLMFSTVMLTIGLLFVFYCPTGDYSEWKTQDEIQLAELSDGENIKYLKTSGKDSSKEVTFRYVTESEFGTEKILAKIAEDENTFVEIVEADDIDEPFVVIQNREAETNWTFKAKDSQTKYIFYIPTGTVIYEKEMKLLN